MKFPSTRITAAIAITCLFASSANGTTLLEVYTLAAENDHQFKAAEAAYEAGLEDKNVGRSGLLPKLNANASYDQNNSELSGVSDTIQSLPSETDGTDSGYAVTLQQPLFDMAAWNNYKAGKASADISESQFKAEEQSLIIRVAQAYFDTLQAADNLNTRLAEEEALEQQLEQTRQRFEVGLSAITEVHEAQAAYDSSVAERLIAAGLLGISFEALEVITGQQFTQLSPLKDDFEVVGPQPAERESWVSRAMENNYQLAAAKFNADSARYIAKSRKAGHYPVVTLNGTYSNFNRDATTDSAFGNGLEDDYDTENQSIGLTLTVPIYNGGGVSASRRQAQQQAIQARELYLQAQRDTVQAARSQHLSVVTSVSTVKARLQAIVSNQSALEATQAGYSVGTRDLVDVLNAQRGLSQAQRDYYTALYAYILSSLSLKEVSGMLSVDDLDQLNAWLDITKLVQKSSAYE